MNEQRICEGPTEMVDKLRTLGQIKCASRRSYLFRQGESKGNFYYVQEGLLKAFYETPDGKLYIKSFIKEGGFIASMRALLLGELSSFSVVCLENSKVLEVPRSALMHAVDSEPSFVRMLNSVLLNVASNKEQREYELLCLSAEERYMLFLEREPDLLGRLSQEDIARYLGITPVSLCRIRKRKQHPK